MLGRITYWNNSRAFGFVTVSVKESGGTFQEQYFFHHSNFVNFKKGEVPMLGGIVTFNLGDPLAEGKKIQAVGVKYATAEEIVEHERRLSPGVIALLKGGQQ